ncbi:hypothetical protein ACP4OV_013779 [Aristida adscensionis]
MDRISELPDDVLVGILSLLRYRDAVKTACVSRRWERLHAQLPVVDFTMSYLNYLRTTLATPSEQRVRSMERTLRRRCLQGDAVRELSLGFRRDVAMESAYADGFAALANAPKLELHVMCATGLPGEDAGAWSFRLPPATAELRVLPYWYAVRPPRIHGPGAATLRSLTLSGPTVLRQEFLLAALPSLEDLHLRYCTLDTGTVRVASDTMPRLRHLAIADVCVMALDTKAAISVAADELRTLRVSCHRHNKIEAPSEDEWFHLPARFHASFTSYSSFRLRAPRLRVFEWRCCYADEVRVESVGRLSDVAVEIAAGRIPRAFEEERRFVTTAQRDKLMSDILQGLMPGLHPRSWANVKSQNACSVTTGGRALKSEALLLRSEPKVL